MQDEIRNCGCGCNDGCGCNNNCGCNNCGCGNNGFLGNLFGRNGCGDSEILFFIIVFLLLFTNFGCGCGRGC